MHITYVKQYASAGVRISLQLFGLPMLNPSTITTIQHAQQIPYKFMLRTTFS